MIYNYRKNKSQECLTLEDIANRRILLMLPNLVSQQVQKVLGLREELQANLHLGAKKSLPLKKSEILLLKLIQK